MKIAKAIFGLALAALATGCAGTTVADRVLTNKVFAMVDQTLPTDQFMVKIFKQTDAIIIREGRGGELNGMLSTLKYLDENQHKLIVIDGVCASACTLLLTRPENVVFTENAVFRFHSAAVYSSDKKSYQLAPVGNAKMFDLFPEEVQEWILDTDAFGSIEFTDMDNETARAFFPRMYMEASKLPDLMDHGSLNIK
ncbi:hypothetical protein D3C72_258760 [compost metagenome]